MTNRKVLVFKTMTVGFKMLRFHLRTWNTPQGTMTALIPSSSVYLTPGYYVCNLTSIKTLRR